MSFRVFFCYLRCSSSFRGGACSCGMGCVGRAVSGRVLSCGGRGCVPDGVHQQHLGLLRWLRALQGVLHAAHHHHYVGTTNTHTYTCMQARTHMHASTHSITHSYTHTHSLQYSHKPPRKFQPLWTCCFCQREIPTAWIFFTIQLLWN